MSLASLEQAYFIYNHTLIIHVIPVICFNPRARQNVLFILQNPEFNVDCQDFLNILKYMCITLNLEKACSYG